MSEIIIVVAGNKKNLDLAAEFSSIISKQGVSLKTVELVSLDLPLYTPVEEAKGIPPAVLEYHRMFSEAKGFVFVSPEYNGGIPPVLTNILAWISRSGTDDWRAAFNGKPAAIASFSGRGGFQLLVSLRTQLAYIGLNVIGRQVRGTFKEDINPTDVTAVADLLVKGVRS